MSPVETVVERAADLLLAQGPAVVFTGAGLSTESGIPDFRGPDGLWARRDPGDLSFQRFVGSAEGRRRYWAVGREFYARVRGATPNAAHHAITTLERLGLVACVITQNVDNLHQCAGLARERVIELHGNATRARCLDCGTGYSRDEIQDWLEAGEAEPACRRCGGIIKPYTVLFGEPMPVAALRAAEAQARRARCFVVAGSSLAVYPAAYLPRYAKDAGARLVVINLTPTRLDHLADLVISGRAGAVMPQLVEGVRRGLASARAATAARAPASGPTG